MTNEEFIEKHKQTQAKRERLLVLKETLVKLKKEYNETENFISVFGRDLEIYKGIPLVHGGFACANRSFTERTAGIYPQYMKSDAKDWGIKLKKEWGDDRFYGCYYTEETARYAGKEWVATGVIIPEVQLQLGKDKYYQQFRSVETFLSSKPISKSDIPELLTKIRTKKDEKLAAQELIKFGYEKEEAHRMIEHILVINGFIR